MHDGFLDEHLCHHLLIHGLVHGMNELLKCTHDSCSRIGKQRGRILKTIECVARGLHLLLLLLLILLVTPSPHYHLLEHPERPIQSLVQQQHGRHVLAAVAVIGSRPHGDQIVPREHVLEALLDHLVTSADQLQTVRRRKLVHWSLAEDVPRPARTVAETVRYLGIGPQQVAEGAARGDLHHAVQCSDLRVREMIGTHLVDCGDGGREAAVNAQNPIVDQLR